MHHAGSTHFLQLPTHHLAHELLTDPIESRIVRTDRIASERGRVSSNGRHNHGLEPPQALNLAQRVTRLLIVPLQTVTPEHDAACVALKRRVHEMGDRSGTGLAVARNVVEVDANLHILDQVCNLCAHLMRSD